MSKAPSRSQSPVVGLPPTAPQIRMSAGMGSPGQKTWNLRKPITVIGSRRPASIVLHDQGVAKAHCVIVNTGTDVLLMDLHTASGTFRNKQRVTLTVLQDGDVITVGETRMQIAIRVPTDDNDDSGCGMEVLDPVKFPRPIAIQLEHTQKIWRFEDAVVLIGRHEDALIRLDNPDISERHAVVFRLGDQPAVCDLGSRTGLAVNGEATALAMVRPGDRMRVGPFTLVAGSSSTANANGNGTPAQAESALPSCDSQGAIQPEISASPPVPTPHCSIGSGPEANGPDPATLDGACAPAPDETTSDLPASSIAAETDRALAQIEADLSKLQQHIGESWERLNGWEARFEGERNNEDEDEIERAALANRATELEARDAELRGQLHDLTRYHAEIVNRERDLAAHAAGLQDREDRVRKAEAELTLRETELAKRTEELHRREHVVAQRWSRLQSMSCPHCRKPMNLSQTRP